MLDLSVLAAHADHLRLCGRAATTIYARKRAVTRLAAWLLPVALLAATPADLTRWRASLTTGDDATVAYVCHVQQFYFWAVNQGLITTNPAAGLPVPRTSRRIPRPVSEDDLMRALGHATPRVRPWLVLAGWAGLRAKEIAYLRRENILDTASPPVLIVAEGATKGHGERTVPLSVFVLAELAAYGLPGSGWAFTRHDGQRSPNAPWLVSHLANEALRESGTSATLHQLRHRFLTAAYRATHDLRLVQELAGHASPNTTAGYAAYDRAEAVAAVESIPAPRRLRKVV